MTSFKSLCLEQALVSHELDLQQCREWINDFHHTYKTPKAKRQALQQAQWALDHATRSKDQIFEYLP